jgi:hypothetical protein
LALKTAEAVRKNLRLLYKNGKINRAQAMEQVEEMKGKLHGDLFSHLLQKPVGKRKVDLC